MEINNICLGEFNMKVQRLLLVLVLGVLTSTFVFGDAYWLYSARWEGSKELSDAEMAGLAKLQGSLEYVEFSDDGILIRNIVQFGKVGVGFPGFTSLNRALLEKFANNAEKGVSEDGKAVFKVQMDGITLEWFIAQTKGNEGICETRCYINNKLFYIEQRKELYCKDGVRPTFIRWDYQSGDKKGTIVQLFEPYSGVKSDTDSEFKVKGGLEEVIKVDPKGDPGKAVETQPVQFTAPMKGLNLSFDSGWWPNGKGEGGFEEQPGGFPVQVRIRAAAVANYQADIQGFFHLSDNWLIAGSASGFWGYDFGGELYMKAGFDIGIIPPFIVDIPYIPDILLRSSKYDYFNSFLLDTVSVLQDETPKTHLFDVNLVDLILKLVGVTLPDWLKWIPFSAGAGIDISTKTDGSLECDTISLEEGLLFWTEGQTVPVTPGETGYRSVMNYNEICNLILTIKFYPTVYISIFGARWDLPIMTIPWSPFNGPMDLEFRPCEINFTSEPPSQPATDWFTEDFVVDNDLDNKRLLLTPANNANGYFACTTTGITDYPVDSILSTAVNLGDDAYVEVPLADGKQVVLYGVAYDRVFIGSNGYLTFTEGDTQNKESPENHFSIPRVSGLFDNLKPNDGGQIWYKQLDDRFVVTYHEVRVDGNFTNDTASFQIEMFFDGRIAITWLNIEAYDGLAGISTGKGVPSEYKESDLSRYAPCIEPEGSIEGFPEGGFEGEGSVEGSIEGEGELPEWCPKPCAVSNCGNTAIQSNTRQAWEAFCAYMGMNPLSVDLDDNLIIETGQLQLLDVILGSPGANNRCCVLTAWQNNYSFFTVLIDGLISEGKISEALLSQVNASKLKAMFAGLTTLGEDSAVNLAINIGNQTGVIFSASQIDRSASQYLGASGDADTDRVCNLAEYNATFDGSTDSIFTFVINAVDPTARSNGGGCGAPCFSETNEGEILPVYQLTVMTEGNTAPVSVQVSPISSEGLNPGYYYLGTNITATAFYNDTRDIWQGWMINGQFVGTANPISFSITQNTVITALFVPIQIEGEGEGEVPSIIPVIEPFILGLGTVPSGECKEGSFTITNSEFSTGVLIGSAVINPVDSSVGDAFQIVSGASYELTPGEGQQVVVRFCSGNLEPKEYVALVSFSAGENVLIYPVVVGVEASAEGEGGGEEGEGEGVIEGTLEGEGTPEGSVEGATEGQVITIQHSADTNGNWKIELPELLRVIQIFNSWGYYCALSPTDTEDGYEVGPGPNHSCTPHASDYNPQDWKIELRELLRVIQFFNSGGYHKDPLGEDGFAPGQQT